MKVDLSSSITILFAAPFCKRKVNGGFVVISMVLEIVVMNQYFFMMSRRGDSHLIKFWLVFIKKQLYFLNSIVTFILVDVRITQWFVRFSAVVSRISFFIMHFFSEKIRQNSKLIQK